MATDDAGGPDTGSDDGTADKGQSSATTGQTGESSHPATVGEYTWKDYLQEYGHESAAETLYANLESVPGSERWDAKDGSQTPRAADWERTDVDPVAHLGFHPDDLPARIGLGHGNAQPLHEWFEAFCDPSTTPVVKDEWMWEHYKREYFYEDDGSVPTAGGEKVDFDAADALGYDDGIIDHALARAGSRAKELSELVDERTVDIQEDFDEDTFFTTAEGMTTVTNRYDLEKAVPMEKKTHFREIERYWVNKPYAFIIIFKSTKENEKKYYVVEPYLNQIESDLEEYLTGKLRTAIKYGDEELSNDSEDDRREVIRRETHRLLDRYDLYSRDSDSGFANTVADQLGVEVGDDGPVTTLFRMLGYQDPAAATSVDGISARPEPVVLEENAETLSGYQVEKLLYVLTRDFIGYERIDAIKQDINVEDISCDGYNSPVFVYHGEYEQIISNVFHGETELDEFVVKLAQRSGKGISKRRPQVDATLPDGSRAQLTLGREVSDHGTNYTIRQFKDVPFTPLDLINWKTFSLDEMAFLWLCIENNKSLIFAGGTASGKTTSLNAVSLFIPSNTKIVSIEDTREVELPQRNWIASVTRPSFTDDDKGDVDEFDLLEAALRQRPDYIVMGEIRGEEGRTLFQVMSTGHTTYTTFHADSVGEVLKRFTTEPINVSKTMFTALDLVSIQTSTRVQGRKVRRNKSLTEINHYDAENDEINVQDVYQWQAETDEYLKMGESNTLDEIMFDRGWNYQTLRSEIFQRQVVLAYLIVEGLNTYTQVAATFQAFINDPETILSLMATDRLEQSLEDLREMESVLIDIDPEKEKMVPRPDPNDEILAEAKEILERAEEELFAKYRDTDVDVSNLADALGDIEPAADIAADPFNSALDESDDTPALGEGKETPTLGEGEDTPALGEGMATPEFGNGDDEAVHDTTPSTDQTATAAANGGDDDGFTEFETGADTATFDQEDSREVPDPRDGLEEVDADDQKDGTDDGPVDQTDESETADASHDTGPVDQTDDAGTEEASRDETAEDDADDSEEEEGWRFGVYSEEDE